MSKFLITFFVESEDHKNNIINKIQTSGNWTNLMPNVYCLDSNIYDPESLRSLLMSRLTKSEKLFIVDITKDKCASFNIV